MGHHQLEAKVGKACRYIRDESECGSCALDSITWAVFVLLGFMVSDATVVKLAEPALVFPIHPSIRT